MNTTENDTQLTHEQIATSAYLLWESDGRPDGRDAEYWDKAQKNLKSRSAKTGSASSATRPAAPTTGSTHGTETKPQDAARKGKQSNGSARRQPAFA